MSTIKTWQQRMTADYSGNTPEAMDDEITDLRAAFVKAEVERDEANVERSWSDKKYAILKNDVFNLEAERDALKSSNESYIALANTAYEITEQRTEERDAALAKLAAAGAAPVPEGWQLVPTEPTDELIEMLYGPYLTFVAHESRKKSYKEMLAAAPKEPS